MPFVTYLCPSVSPSCTLLSLLSPQDDGMGPLHVACAKGYADVAKVLVALGGRTSENKGVSYVSVLAKVGPGEMGAGVVA